jgi:S1-C subfamily serine protease
MIQVPVPPEAPSPAAGPEPVEVIKIVSSAGPWKVVSGIAGGITAVLLGVLILGGRGGGGADLEAVEGQVARLKRDLERRDAELDELKEKRSDSGNADGSAKRVKELEADREGLRKELAEARSEMTRLRAQIPAGKPAVPPETGRLGPEPPKPPEPGPKPAEAAASPPDSKPHSATELADSCAPAAVAIKTNSGVGAGFFITPDGVAVTNYHVITRTTERKVVYYEGKGKERARREAEAQVFAIDEKNNLALVKANVRSLVPVVTLEKAGSVHERDEVLMLGIPARGDDGDPPTVLWATVGNLSRNVYGTNCVETTLAVPDEICGAAAFNRAGKVIGIATSRGTEGEKTGLVIPVGYLHTLIAEKETTFAVKGSLAEWEAKLGVKPSYDTSKGIKVEGNLIRIQIDEDRNRIVGLDIKNRSLVVLSFTQRKVLRAIPTGSEPSDFQISPNPDVAWVSHASTRTLIKVDLAEGKVYDRIDMDSSLHRFVASRNFIWTYGGRTLLFPLKDKKPVYSPLKFGAMAYDRRRDRVVGLVTNWVDQKLVEFDPDKVGPIMKDIAEVTEAGPNGPRWKDLDDLNKELMKLLKICSIPAEYWDWSATGQAFTLIADGSSRVYLNQAVLRQEKMDSILGYARPERYSRWKDPMSVEAARLLPLHDRIIAGSPDGKWIVNATHIYDGEKFIVYRELPIPAVAMAFTSDSKTLFLFDAVNQMLLPLDLETKGK